MSKCIHLRLSLWYTWFPVYMSWYHECTFWLDTLELCIFQECISSILFSELRLGHGTVIPCTRITHFRYHCVIHLKCDNHLLQCPSLTRISEISKLRKYLSREWADEIRCYLLISWYIDLSRVYGGEVDTFSWSRTLNNRSCDFSPSPDKCSFESCFSLPHPYIDTIICLSSFTCGDDSPSSIFDFSYTESLERDLCTEVISFRCGDHPSKYWNSTRSMRSISIESPFYIIVALEIELLTWKWRIVCRDDEFLSISDVRSIATRREKNTEAQYRNAGIDPFFYPREGGGDFFSGNKNERNILSDMSRDETTRRKWKRENHEERLWINVSSTYHIYRFFVPKVYFEG